MVALVTPHFIYPVFTHTHMFQSSHRRKYVNSSAHALITNAFSVFLAKLWVTNVDCQSNKACGPPIQYSTLCDELNSFLFPLSHYQVHSELCNRVRNATIHYYNKSDYLPIYRATKQPINLPFLLLTYLPINQSINCPINQPSFPTCQANPTAKKRLHVHLERLCNWKKM